MSRLWKPFTQMTDLEAEAPLEIVSGRGRWLVDRRGRRLYDGVSSLWASVHGHRVGEIDRAVRAQLGRIAHTTLLGPTHPGAEALAEALVGIAPPGLSRVFLSDNGSTAVEAALKIAFQYHRQKPRPEPRRTRFLSFTDAYHGDTLGAVGVGGIPLFHRVYGPLVRPSLKVRPGDLAGLARVLRRHGDRIAAFVFEPLVQGAAGIRLHSPEFLRRAAAMCRRRGILLVADEVATGFGRTGTMFACTQAGVRPDLLCAAKGVTGGYLPLAATLSTGRVYRAFLGRYDEFRAFFHGHTYSGNPLACAAGLASLRLLRRLLPSLPARGEALGRALDGLRGLPWVADARRRGLMAGIEVRGGARAGHRVCLACRPRGLLIRPLGDVVVLMPPLTATPQELRWMVATVRAAAEEVLP